jgi:hypothetical protein
MTCRISRFQDGGSLNNYITISLAEGICRFSVYSGFSLDRFSVYSGFGLDRFHSIFKDLVVVQVNIAFVHSTI